MLSLLADTNLGLAMHALAAEPVRGAICNEEGAWRWADILDTECVPLASLLGARLLPKHSDNAFVILWRKPDDRLAQTLRFLLNQPGFAIHFHVFLIGPWQESEFEADLHLFESALGDRLDALHFWTVGNESSAGKKIGDEERLIAASGLAALFCTGGEDAYRQWEMDPQRNDHQPFHAFGTYSLIPPIKNLDALRKAFARSLLNDAVEDSLKSASPESLKAELASGPARELKEILTFQFREHCQVADWPEHHANIFVNWKCPLTRFRATQAFEAAIASDNPKLMDQIRKLREELAAHAVEIRRAIQEFAVQRREATRQWLLGQPSLFQIAMLLEHYFPAFEALDQRMAGLSKTPATSANDPAEDDIKRMFVTKQRQIFEGHRPKLLFWVDALVWPVAGVASAGAAWWLATTGTEPHWTFTPPALAIIAFVIRCLLAWLTTRRIRTELASERQKHLDFVHMAFRAKIDRVAKTARCTAALQFIANNRRIAQRLQRQFRSFFGKWTAVQTQSDVLTPDEAAQRLRREGVSESPVAKARAFIRDIGKALLGNSIDGSANSIELVEAFGVVRGEGGGAARSEVIPPERIRDEIEALAKAWQGNQFPVWAKLSSSGLGSRILRIAAIPEDQAYDALFKRLDEMLRPTNTMVRLSRLPVRAPIVFQIMHDVSSDQLRAALKVTTIR